jgi:hypothetical protein
MEGIVLIEPVFILSPRFVVEIRVTQINEKRSKYEKGSDTVCHSGHEFNVLCVCCRQHACPATKIPATQDGQPPRHDDKNPQHTRERTNKDGKTWKHDGKSSNHDNKEWKHDDSMRNHDGKRPPRDGKKPPLPEEKR